MYYDVNSRKGKRVQSVADQLVEREASKSKKSTPNPGATVRKHFDGCDKRNHHWRICLSGKPKSRHPDFNEHGPWRDRSAYRGSNSQVAGAVQVFTGTTRADRRQ